MIQRPSSCADCTKACAVYFTVVAGGKAMSHACCQDCPTLQAAAADGQLPSVALGLKLDIPTPQGRGKCPTCGFRWADFVRIHRMGCPTCYQTHAQEALETIARIQPGIEHQGRRPLGSAADTLMRLTKARQLLKEALKDEDYETAAVLRDQISDLEGNSLESKK